MKWACQFNNKHLGLENHHAFDNNVIHILWASWNSDAKYKESYGNIQAFIYWQLHRHKPPPPPPQLDFPVSLRKGGEITEISPKI